MRRLVQYSKKIITAMIVLWFACAIFGGYMVYTTKMDLSALLNFVGAPMTAGILGYLLKAAFENKEKIKQSGELDVSRTNNGQNVCAQPDPMESNQYRQNFPN